MALYVFKQSDGTLVSWSPNDTDPVASDAVLAAKGWAKVTGLLPLDDTHAWDAPTHTVVVVAFTPIRFLSVFDFANRFTPAELAAIRASANPGVQKFVFMLPLAINQTIDLNSPVITTVMALLVAQGLLTQVRANAMVA